MDLFDALARGFAISAALIIAIGAQNAFVLRQGVRGEHVGAVVLFCIACDALLIAAGVLGFGSLLAQLPGLDAALRIGGGLFLGWYALQAARRALHPGSLAGPAVAGNRRQAALAAVLGQAAGFTLLNPHVYLDTVVLVGAIGAQQPQALQPWFVLGGACASAAWFSALGYGARRLSPWLARPRVWRAIEGLIALTMGWLAITLLVGGW